jgi:hypothetical protein
MKLSFRKKMSKLLPDIVQTENNQNYYTKAFNIYRLNTVQDKKKNQSIGASPSSFAEKNYFKDKFFSPNSNKNNNEKTEYSSNINDIYLSKIQANSEIKQIFKDVKLNKTISPKNKSEASKFYTKSKNASDNFNKMKTFSTSSCWYRKTDNFDSISNLNDVNSFDTEKINKFSSIFVNYKNHKIKNRKNNFLYSTKNNKTQYNRFNSLNLFIDSYLQMDENKLLNRYHPNYKEYLGKSEYDKLNLKSKKLLNTKEKIKVVFKDTKLIMAMCDYLNTSLAKLNSKKRKRIKDIKKEAEEIKINEKNMQRIKSKIKNDIIPINNMCRIKTKKRYIKRRTPLIYKNGYLSKSFKFPSSLSYKAIRRDIYKKDKEIISFEKLMD